MVPNPVLVEVTRGSRVESRHCGAVAIVDGDGAVVASLGDIGAPVFPRSAVKALQAIRLVEGGAAKALGLTNAELALACSSHNGEARHVAAARRMLAAAGLDDTALECGAQWPALEDDVAALNRAGQRPAAVHNNCSGKHAGFLCLAHHEGHATRGYVAPDHPVQREVRDVLAAMTGATLDENMCGTDGCSIPTYATPLKNLAQGFARFATGNGLSPARTEACRTLYAACTSEPTMVAGTGRFCTRLMTAMSGDVFAKTGAEGVFCGAIPSLGLGIALKCDDGATRAAEIMMANVLARLLPDDRRLVEFTATRVLNRNAWHVGDIRSADGAFDGIRS